MNPGGGKEDRGDGEEREDADLRPTCSGLELHDGGHGLYISNRERRIDAGEHRSHRADGPQRLARCFYEQILRRVEGEAAVRHLFVGKIHLWLADAFQAAHPNVSHHADDRAFEEREREGAAERVAARPVPFRERLAHDRHERRLRVI